MDVHLCGIVGSLYNISRAVTPKSYVNIQSCLCDPMTQHYCAGGPGLWAILSDSVKPRQSRGAGRAGAATAVQMHWYSAKKACQHAKTMHACYWYSGLAERVDSTHMMRGPVLKAARISVYQGLRKILTGMSSTLECVQARCDDRDLDLDLRNQFVPRLTSSVLEFVANSDPHAELSSSQAKS